MTSVTNRNLPLILGLPFARGCIVTSVLGKLYWVHKAIWSVMLQIWNFDVRALLTMLILQLLVAGGGMYVEVFNIGVILLAYSIKKKNKAGESNTYLDGIYLLFTYFTKPESMAVLEGTLQTDDDVIRSSTFKIRKRKY
ncbi:hypothetical protein TEA_003377 [Camellia sinensis var. sinensis]|uniref:Uncharacterized protein n=1 Tax=Camellia sinensis var. sinensis TaxID=542762 RepID=A0A4S4DDE3_CAMSN|nr:hypothetical protein TEA_003377 [Camellia sinensis var. sinensis]